MHGGRGGDRDFAAFVATHGPAPMVDAFADSATRISQAHALTEWQGRRADTRPTVGQSSAEALGAASVPNLTRALARLTSERNEARERERQLLRAETDRRCAENDVARRARDPEIGHFGGDDIDRWWERPYGYRGGGMD